MNLKNLIQDLLEIKELEGVKQTAFYAPPSIIRLFKEHCKAIGVDCWRGFSEAVCLWVEATKDRRVVKPVGFKK